MANIAIIFAAGNGQRLKNFEIKIPKQFIKIDGKPILVYTLELFEYHPQIDEICVAIHPDYVDYFQNLVEKYHLSKVKGTVIGGKTGQESIYKALKLAAENHSGDSLVLIHDGVRPNITPEVISENIAVAQKKGNAITSTNCYETIVYSKDFEKVDYIPLRKETFSAQAPQTFHLKEILAAHEIIQGTNPNYEGIVDSATLFYMLKKPTFLVKGNRGNIKITTIEDLYILRAYINYKENLINWNLTDKK